MKSLFLSTLLFSLLFTVFAQGPTLCGSDLGILDGTNCLCQSAYSYNGADCVAETLGSCPTPPTPDTLNSPPPVSLGAGVTDDSFILNINVPFEDGRILTKVTFDASATTPFDYPTDFADWTRAVTESSCSDTFSITMLTTALPTQIIKIDGADNVEYSGTVFVTTFEFLPDNSTRTISQQLAFDYTFPIVTASINNIDVISSVGTILMSNILQQANAGNEIELVIQLSTPYPYQLDFIASAPVTGDKFSGVDVDLPSPALNYTLGGISPCSSTAPGATCVQTATVNIDYGLSCSVDGSYTLRFAVTGCNTGGGSPSVDCLITNSNTVELLPVTVAISSLKMGNLCVSSKTYRATASDLVSYADDTFTTEKSSFIADSSQLYIYLGTVITLEDTVTKNAYKGYTISKVERNCAGVSTCTSSYVAFDISTIHDYSANETSIDFSVPVAGFTEVKPAYSDIPYLVRVTLALLFSDNSKREVVFERQAMASQSASAVGTVQFVSANVQPNNNDNNNDDAEASSGSKTSFSALSIAALCVGIVALVASI